VPLIFLFIIYNQKREAKAQEEQVMLVCDGDEIPIGEAIDETLTVGHNIINESQKMIDASLVQINAANELLALADQCKAENCDTDCDAYTYQCNPHPCEVVKAFSEGSSFATSNIKQLQLFFDLNSFLKLLVPSVRAACDDVSCNSVGGICCADTCIKWWEDENNCGSCGHICRAGSTCGLRLPGDYGSGAICWGTCYDTCTGCTVLPCSGSPCPTGEISNALSQIQNSYSQIVASKNAIDDEITKGPGIIAKLEEARAELPKCVTPAGELTEAEAKEAQTLYTCKEALYERALPSGKTECDNLKNFICCYYK
jgi:hypothetical protein